MVAGQKTAKIIKQWYFSASHWYSGNVMVGNYHLFMLFAFLIVRRWRYV